MLVVVGLEILPGNWCSTLCQTDVEMEDRIEIGVVVGDLKGSFTIFLFLVRSHILNSNGMWYS